MADIRRLVVHQRAGYRCEYCGYPEAASSTPLEVDHIIPEARGGLSTLDNLALCCRACHLYKHVQVEAIDPLTGLLVPLFQPRAQQWSAHLSLDRATGMMCGLTPAGRATVEALRMNAPHALATRTLLMRLGLVSSRTALASTTAWRRTSPGCGSFSRRCRRRRGTRCSLGCRQCGRG